MEGASEDNRNLREFLEESDLIQYRELFRDILKVTKLSQLKFVLTEDLAHIGLSKPEQRRYKKIYCKYFPNPYLAKIKRLITSNKRNDLYNQGPNSMPIEFNRPFPENTFKGPTKHIIPVEDITINKELGMGQFGVVQLGTWNTGTQRLQVAIKCLGHERMTSNSTEFLKEAAVMHSIEHPNIVRLYGVVLHLDSLMLVTELAPLRSLLECLREVSLRANFPVPSLCEFAEQICGGMTYLENKRLIHRDLAARNILVFSKDRVKISDFGLSRALGVGKDYYQTNYNVNLKLPVAWCAPECILYLKFTSGSDIWAFGVCLWEMFTYGFQPWAAFSGQQILEAIDAPNYNRLERPECCPELYYTTMLECWSHDPNDRPKFKDLEIKLREIRPEQVVALEDYKKPNDARCKNYLEYKSGQTLTVLGKESMTKCNLWYGVLPGATCGVFDPNKTTPYVKTPKSSHSPQSTTSHGSVRLPSNIRPTILRSDQKRHTFTGKRTLHRSMISGPQGDVKHTGHVGLDGAYFGDIPFFDPTGCPPKQVVTPYKPSEDMEEQPLINPNSPSHLTGSSETPPNYPQSGQEPAPATRRAEASTATESEVESRTLNGAIPKVRSSSRNRMNRHAEAGSSAALNEELHQYHEISDIDPVVVAENNNWRTERFVASESPSTSTTSAFSSDIENAFRSYTLGKQEKKKTLDTGTMKPMSAHEEKTLETAVALANKLSTRSMNDLKGEKGKAAQSSAEKLHKFCNIFPKLHANLANQQGPADAESLINTDKTKTFVEEVPTACNIQESLPESSKAAYQGLIEQPTIASSYIWSLQKTDEATAMAMLHRMNLHGATHVRLDDTTPKSVERHWRKDDEPQPLRAPKPPMTNNRRHVRIYPLVDRPAAPVETNSNTPPVPTRSDEAIYQNLQNGGQLDANEERQYQNVQEDVASDGAVEEGTQTGTNPFQPAQVINPFIDPVYGATGGARSDENLQTLDVSSLMKDYVSVEDLLEFADQKPCGRQRGEDSDEVRILCNVFGNQVTSELCIAALEVSEWNVYFAVKILCVYIDTGRRVTLKECATALVESREEIAEASRTVYSYR